MELRQMTVLPSIEDMIDEARITFAETGQSLYKVFRPDDFLDYWDMLLKERLGFDVILAGYRDDKLLPALMLEGVRLVIVSCAEECD